MSHMISCLCPTFKRPKLLANAIACFIAQEYDSPAELVILDDAGQYPHDLYHGVELPRNLNVRLVSYPNRLRSLPEKYNALAAMAYGDRLVVWEDDDIYLPWHLAAHHIALERHGYSHPSRVWSLYTGKLDTEAARWRFHASIAFRRETLDAVGGWPSTRALEFDQQFMANLVAHCGEDIADPNAGGAFPSYVFRWASTLAYHGQAYPSATWYDDVGRLPLDGEIVPRLKPEYDAETRSTVLKLERMRWQSVP